jgi:hypothetical protein
MRNIFKHSLINGTIFEKKKLNIIIIIIFFLHFHYKFVRNIFNSKKNWGRFGDKYLLILT